MKILVNDGMSEAGMEQLRAAGHEVFTNKVEQVDLPAHIAEYDAIVVRSATKVRQDVIDAGIPNLKAVVRGGVGVDNIDVAYAEEKGVKVMNTPAASSASVAELAIGHMFAVARFIVAANVTMRNNEWNKKAYKGTEIAGKTLGILGIGRIGFALAEKAIALGMKVQAFDPFVEKVDIDVEMTDKDTVLANADYLSLHLPFDKAVGAVVGAAEIAKMKNGAILINCARGGVVDEDALLEALNSGKLAGAGVDVFLNEPEPRRDLIEHPKVSVTPHIGASTVEAQNRIGDEIATKLIDFFK